MKLKRQNGANLTEEQKSNMMQEWENIFPVPKDAPASIKIRFPSLIFWCLNDLKIIMFI